MPTNRRYRRAPRRADVAELDPLLRWELRWGPKGNHSGELLEAAYGEHRDQIVAEFAADHPGRRPWAWWAFEGAEFGLRPERWEDEAAFLRSHGLLSPAEAQRLGAL